MAGGLNIYMAMTTKDAAAAEGYGLPGLYLLYRIGMEGLQKAPGGKRTSGGIMGIVEAPGLGLIDLSTLARNIYSECGNRGFSGVLFDFFAEIHQQDSLTRLASMLAGQGLAIYLSHEYTGCYPGCKIIVSSMSKGGSFNSALLKHSSTRSPGDLCLEIVRACHEYPMPAMQNNGKRLDTPALRALLEQYRPTPFYSPEMMCRYFSYRTNEGGVNFVLYDDPACALKKIEAARNMGFYAAFILFNDWTIACRDIVMGLR